MGNIVCDILVDRAEAEFEQTSAREAEADGVFNAIYRRVDQADEFVG